MIRPRPPVLADAGSLRDRDRAMIVGSRTYEKASVQGPGALGGGSVIEPAVGRHRTPGGRNLDGAGPEHLGPGRERRTRTG
ncbi:hypothetical protein E1281_15970 [Actinomadura sp. KC345]|uniref:S41 family peptidase n=1 Tax=Actinomadura sp. KC345 TaxID=2530371 RepID=UPI001046120B|nr:S41 family peptidase [Actinomadura sp. KC345]TDC54663.1 hypothetical protein E1281_15970 [Actinomadura sp. KC345]